MSDLKNRVPARSKMRAKAVFDKVMASGGKISMSKAMIESGYRERYAHNPQYLTRSKIWKELIDEYLPDDLLLNKHLELLNKVDEKGNIDVPSASRALDLAYRIKNKYQENTNIQINNVIPLLGGDSSKNVPKDDSNGENTETEQKD